MRLTNRPFWNHSTSFTEVQSFSLTNNRPGLPANTVRLHMVLGQANEKGKHPSMALEMTISEAQEMQAQLNRLLP